jgi:hypothetical protein
VTSARFRVTASPYRTSRSHSDTRHSVGLPTHRSLTDNTQRSQERHPSPRCDSNPAMPASKRPQIHALDHAATGTCTERITNAIHFSVNKRLVSFSQFLWRSISGVQGNSKYVYLLNFSVGNALKGRELYTQTPK